jgi:hypothetical protein
MNPDEPLRAGDVIFYWSIFVCGTPQARRVSTILEIDTSRLLVLTMDYGEFVEGRQQVMRVKMLVNGELIDNPHAEFKQVVEYKLENSMTESYQQSRKSAYSQSLGTSLESFRNNYHNYASATNMPVDLVRGSVGTNSVQVVPINEVVASLTSTPIGLRKQPYARDHTSNSPTFNGESDDNHKEEGESQGDTQEDLKSQGSDKES